MPIQDSLIPEYVPPLETTSKEESKKEPSTGSKVNPSQIEILSQIYKQYSESESELQFLSSLKKQEKEENILENAQWSIYGTQMHSLQYFSLLNHRAKYYDRYPTYDDFRHTFLQRQPEYYSSLDKITQLTDTYSDPLIYSQNFWNEWRMNGQNFTPENHKNYILSPTRVKQIWENGVIPVEHIYEFKKNFLNIYKEKLNPEKTFLINETFLILNMYFNNSSLLIPTLIDEICIPKDFPKSPIKVVDYKTGKQFKQPEYKERIQIYLMVSSVIANIAERVDSIKFNFTDWEVMHSNTPFQFPHFEGKKGIKKFVSSIYCEHMSTLFNEYIDRIQFSYINPLTQESIDIDLKEIVKVENINIYLSNISDFYLKYKKVLKHKLDSSNSPYTLPTFPLKNFEKSNGFSKGVQLPLNMIKE